MNAVQRMLGLLSRRALLAMARRSRKGEVLSSLSSDELRVLSLHHHESDLCGFLNSLKKSALDELATELKLKQSDSLGELRFRLWRRGALWEAGSEDHLGQSYLPQPGLLSERLVIYGPLRGAMPKAEIFPRPIPEPAAPSPTREEPETLEALLERADELVGLRLGQRGADKGQFGVQIAALLGVHERGLAEADWRGEVEIKSVPVTADRRGAWRIKEDPAISMEGVDPRGKLQRVLWMIRVHGGDSPILSYYYQELDDRLSLRAARYLHHRPKGAKGTSNKGWYLQKGFFTESGLLRSLNG